MAATGMSAQAATAATRRRGGRVTPSTISAPAAPASSHCPMTPASSHRYMAAHPGAHCAPRPEATLSTPTELSKSVTANARTAGTVIVHRRHARRPLPAAASGMPSPSHAASGDACARLLKSCSPGDLAWPARI